MTRLELIAFLVLLAAAIAFAVPRLMTRTYSEAVVSGACDQPTPPPECAAPRLGFAGMHHRIWR